MMKKYWSIVLAVLFAVVMCSLSHAATVTWEHDGINTTGYRIYWYKTSDQTTKWNKSVAGNTVRELVIDDIYFEPNVEYTFYNVAFNLYQTSPQSNTATWTRVLTPIDPVPDKLPTDVYIYQPRAVILNLGR